MMIKERHTSEAWSPCLDHSSFIISLTLWQGRSPLNAFVHLQDKVGHPGSFVLLYPFYLFKKIFFYLAALDL